MLPIITTFFSGGLLSSSCAETEPFGSVPWKLKYQFTSYNDKRKTIGSSNDSIRSLPKFQQRWPQKRYLPRILTAWWAGRFRAPIRRGAITSSTTCKRARLGVLSTPRRRPAPTISEVRPLFKGLPPSEPLCNRIFSFHRAKSARDEYRQWLRASPFRYTGQSYYMQGYLPLFSLPVFLSYNSSI